MRTPKHFALPSTRASLLVVAAVLLAAATVQVVDAGTGKQINLPIPPVKPKHFLSASIETRWIEAPGYRPVRVTLNSLRGVLTRDRKIRVQVTVLGNLQRAYLPVVSQELVIPEGKASVTEEILIPQEEGFGQISFRFFEFGSELKELRHSDWTATYNQYGWTEHDPGVLVIDSKMPPNHVRPSTSMGRIANAANSEALKKYDVPDIRELSAMLGHYDVSVVDTTTSIQLLNELETMPRLEVLPPDELPNSWLGLSCCSVIVLSLDELQSLSEQHPAKLQALREWTTTGTTLCVYGVSDLEERRACENLLALRPVEGAPNRGWKPPSVGYRVERKRPFSNQGQMVTVKGTRQWLTGQQLRDYLNDRRKKDERTEEEKAEDQQRAGFVVRELGFGRVIAMNDKAPFPGVTHQWRWVVNSVDRSGPWYKRLGMSQHRENRSYWRWLIPGVGLPPVWSFLVLISIFVVGIGPVNYLLLKRSRRLYLLLITVPLGAAIITCSLLLYALVMDGFGTRSRLRSATLIDQRANLAATWSRQTYYASITPSRGLVFPKHAGIYLMVPRPAAEKAQVRPTKWLDWGADQSLRRGYMQTRTPAQMMVASAQPSLAEIIVREGSPVSIDNQLQTDIEVLVLRDSQGNFHTADNITDGQSVKLRASDVGTLNKQVDARYKQKKPQAPVANRDSSWLGNQWRNTGWTQVDQQLGRPSDTSSLLEQTISPLRGQLTKMNRRSYIAIVKVSPEVPLGVQNTNESDSFHVIVGRW